MRSIIVILFTVISFSLLGQADLPNGEISFLTSSNVYVRFQSTAKIAIGDTLFIDQINTIGACLIVRQKSSTSCVCDRVNDCKLEKGMSVVHKPKDPPSQEIKTEIKNPDDQTREVLPEEDQREDPTIDPLLENEEIITEQSISGRVSASSYSLFNPESEDRHRLMTRFSLNAEHIQGSKISLETYMNYRRNIESPSVSSEQSGFFRVYNAALRYDASPDMQIYLGRKINRKMSSIGAVDGVQVDKSFNNFYAGGILGFRPDIFAFDFNPDLLEYGAYIGKDFRGENNYGQTTMGVLEQRNGSAVDRRYAYWQYNLSLARKTQIYASAELDLYQNLNGEASMKPRLTNLYVSARYKLSRRFSFGLSYDSRKRIIFYETLRTDVEELLADDQARQGIRARINFKPFKHVYGGLSYSKRFQSDNQNPSDNYNGFISYSRLPLIGGSLNVNANKNSSSYLTSKIISVRYTRPLIRRKLDMDLYFRWVDYDYLGSSIERLQKFYGMNLSVRLTKKMSFNILGERSDYNGTASYRMNTKLIHRI